MALPVFTAGQVLNASDVNSWLQPLAGYKTAVTTRNTLTKAIDPDLQLSLAASSIYQVNANIIHTSGNAMDFTWVIPAGSTGGYTASFNLAGTGAGTWGYIWTATVSSAALGGSTNGILIQGMIQTAGTAGTFGFSWASSTGPLSLIVGIGSCLSVQRVG